jgi:hypothetical protein
MDPIANAYATARILMKRRVPVANVAPFGEAAGLEGLSIFSKPAVETSTRIRGIHENSRA